GSANRLTSTDPRVMLHLLGLSFDFPFRHWDQLANRYGYALEEINPTLENVYWWNLQGDVLMEKRARRDFSADLNNWRYLETIPAPVIEPVMIEEPAPEAATAAPGATDVDITARPASEKAEPIPAVESAPVEPAAAPMPAPIAESAPDAPVVETPAPPVAIEETVESVPAVDIAAEPEVPAVAPTETIVADPFSADEIPAAEIVVPAEPKKSWWKIF
ncbi:MAG: hypothetical protein PHP93_01360, partial [Kiritimatiellales bacterium]|nr:hypothetical protein [Kiritimatiellales bacterium]